MRQSFWNKRIPTVLGMILLVAGISVSLWLVENGSLDISRAAPGDQPKDVRITNVSDTSLTVTYSTDKPVLGTLLYSDEATPDKIAIDDRDQRSGVPGEYRYHYITIKNLDPGKKYFFKIVSGENSYLDNGSPFTMTTAEKIPGSPPSQPPIVGKVILSDGTTPSEAVVFMNTDNSQTLSVMVKTDGSYILPLNSLRTNNLGSYVTLLDDSIIKLLLSGIGGTSSVSVLAKQINPVPVVTLSNNYNFTISDTATDTSLPTDFSGFPTLNAIEEEAGQISTADVDIESPTDQEAFSDQQPLFSGTAVPSEDVEIEINSETAIKANVTADSNGRWSFRPDTPLEPGEHTITIKTRDEFGILKAITRSFVVYAEGSQFTDPSISPPASTPTPTVVATNTPSPTPVIPTDAPSPTPTQIPAVGGEILPTATPSPTLVDVATTPIPTLEATGSSNVLVTGLVGMVAISVGLLIFFFTQGFRL